jgi:hypothetical protein
MNGPPPKRFEAMADHGSARHRYDEARRTFDDLDVEERARFLIEATASTLAHGLLRAGEALADGLEDAIRQAQKRSRRSKGKRGPGAAEPETAQRQAPRNGPRTSGSEE